MANKFITLSGLKYFWDNIKGKFATSTHKHGYISNTGTLLDSSNNVVSSKLVYTDELGNLVGKDTDLSHIKYLDNITSDMQLLLSNKQDKGTVPDHEHGYITNIGKLTTANRVVTTDGSRYINISDITTTELNALDNITGNVQTQLDNRYTKEEVDNKLTSAMHYKGTVANKDYLPSDASVGDFYNVEDTGENYAWSGTEWDKTGTTITTTFIESLEASASASKDAAANSAASASTYASNANDSAVSASNSANAASTSATNASNSAISASNSEAKALEYKNDTQAIKEEAENIVQTADVVKITEEIFEDEIDLVTVDDISDVVRTSRKINDKTLDSDITLTYSDVNASSSTHASTHSTGGSDEITPSSIGAAPAVDGGYLPLSGGTMTGGVLFSPESTTDNIVLSRYGTEGGIGLNGGTTYKQGAWLRLYGQDVANESNKGQFILASYNSTNNFSFYGYPSGDLFCSFNGSSKKIVHGTTFSTGIFSLASFITTGGKEVDFSLPIVLNPAKNWTVSFTVLQIRQNGTYLFGTTASNYSSTIDSFTVLIDLYVYPMRIIMRFANTSSTGTYTNNAPVGIEMNITFTAAD